MCTECMRGFTLVELLMTLAVSGILLGIGLPAMAGLISANRLSTQVNELVSGMALARFEAIHRNTSVVLCKSDNHQTCTTNSSWENGWIIFVDTDDDHKRQDEESILLSNDPLPANYQLQYRGFGSHHYVVFRGIGTTTSNGTFLLCDKRNPENARALIINRTGRVRTSTTRADGTPIECNKA